LTGEEQPQQFGRRNNCVLYYRGAKEEKEEIKNLGHIIYVRN
jgi:hypothetical protein